MEKKVRLLILPLIPIILASIVVPAATDKLSLRSEPKIGNDTIEAFSLWFFTFIMEQIGWRLFSSHVHAIYMHVA